MDVRELRTDREINESFPLTASHTLARGEHLFVDDLVTLEEDRDRGRGAQMIRRLGQRARAEGPARIDLDSRATAKGLYEKIGFNFLTSIPCWMETPAD